VDAFTDSAFKGNPAAVCLLEEARDEQWLQAVAAEFNISETCYLTRLTGSGSFDSSIPRFRLRWFTPVTEVTSFFISKTKSEKKVCFKTEYIGRTEKSIFLRPKC
jgi:PhzF family phenazine biosynthesis protein